jgi:hypothetical protein
VDKSFLPHNAPIIVSNDGMKGAQAYVKIAGNGEAENPATTGAELRRTYQTENGEIAPAYARILLQFYPADKMLQVDLISGPGETRVGFGAKMFGVSQEMFVEKLKVSELDFKGPIPLRGYLKEDELRLIGADPNQIIALVRANTERSLRFETSVAPSGVAPMLLIAPDGAALARISHTTAAGSSGFESRIF